jgi:hypothetical protein
MTPHIFYFAFFALGLFLGVGIGARAWRRRFAALEKAAGAFLLASTDFSKDAQAKRMRYGREVAACLRPEVAKKIATAMAAQEREGRKKK